MTKNEDQCEDVNRGNTVKLPVTSASANEPKKLIDWQAIEKAVCSGMSFREAEKCFGASYDAVKKRANRGKWLSSSVVMRKAKEFKRLQEANGKSPIVTNEALSDLIAVNWLEKQESHRLLAFQLANQALQRAKPVNLTAWQDISIADKMARKASGLDITEQNSAVNVNLALVNQRMMADELPPDA